VHASGDTGFLVECGAEVLVETARLWEDLGFYSDDGAFHIHGVTGPDEYTTLVNDNTYTNLLARLNLRFAAATVRRLASERPDAHAALVGDLGLEPAEPARWERAANAMYIPFDEHRGIHPQDVHFLEREVWDLDATPPEHFPLLVHYHPLDIYRRQVIKQADVVLAIFMAGDAFSQDQKRANFEYYNKLTTGDSSLSACVESIIAAEIGEAQRALDNFLFALRVDLADVAGNASDGVHIAAAGGMWQALVCGFGGVRDRDGELLIDPRLPRSWRSLQYSLRFHGRQLRIDLGHVGRATCSSTATRSTSWSANDRTGSSKGNPWSSTRLVQSRTPPNQPAVGHGERDPRPDDLVGGGLHPSRLALAAQMLAGSRFARMVLMQGFAERLVQLDDGYSL
jgi:alpha,alpha-trehalose phosphorylase